jgi:hypothetical protein
MDLASVSSGSAWLPKIEVRVFEYERWNHFLDKVAEFACVVSANVSSISNMGDNASVWASCHYARGSGRRSCMFNHEATLEFQSRSHRCRIRFCGVGHLFVRNHGYSDEPRHFGTRCGARSVARLYNRNGRGCGEASNTPDASLVGLEISREAARAPQSHTQFEHTCAPARPTPVLAAPNERAASAPEPDAVEFCA